MRGNILLVNFGEPVGLEQNKIRPAVVVSNDGANLAAGQNGRSGLITVAPITSNVEKVYPTEVFIALDPTGATGLKKDSKIQCEQIRAVDSSRVVKGLGQLPAGLQGQLDQALATHLALPNMQQATGPGNYGPALAGQLSFASSSNATTFNPGSVPSNMQPAMQGTLTQAASWASIPQQSYTPAPAPSYPTTPNNSYYPNTPSNPYSSMGNPYQSTQNPAAAPGSYFRPETTAAAGSRTSTTARGIAQRAKRERRRARDMQERGITVVRTSQPADRGAPASHTGHAR